MKTRKLDAIVLRALAFALALAGVEADSHAADQADASRYPYDPVCAWGRIANGRGMLVRCLTEAEARALPVKATAAGQTAGAASNAQAAGDKSTSGGSGGQLTVTVGPVLVEQGTLKLAEKKLRAPADRYAECVQKHGGLTRNEGEVRVRFLVRERGRAEGVGVTKRRSMSQAAAKCIADVVDRRYVGLPEAPIVAATLVVKFKRQAK